MKKIVLVFLVLFIILIVPSTFAKTGHIKLLAAKETSDGYEGSIADLSLEIKKGSGRVFLDTFPLTKMDTQISMRFAKEISCNYLELDCTSYDFFYRITADSTIIGGPSAGAAAAVLTTSMLKNLDVKQDIAMTGTINSGALIGPVGGLKFKIDAAKKENIIKVLIPSGEATYKEENETIDIFNYSKSSNITLKEVSTLGEAVYEFTAAQLEKNNQDFSIDKQYEFTMGYLADILCNRTSLFNEKVHRYSTKIYYINSTRIKNSYEEAINLSKKGNEAFNDKKYYSSASYCFGANTKYNFVLMSMQNLTEKDILEKINFYKRKVESYNNETEKKGYKTITDLESYVSIKERLEDSKESLDKSFLNLNNTEEALYNLAYGIERLNSAYSWGAFSDNRGRQFKFNKDVLKKSCMDKISEAEERHYYLTTLFPLVFSAVKKDIGGAYDDLKEGNYELCLFKASKAKASVDNVLGTLGFEEEQFNELTTKKLDAAKKVLVKETKKGIFPIIGYSYYEYADSLRSSDKYAALLYSEYALELSNLDLYFEEKKSMDLIKIDWTLFSLFMIGVLVGFFIGFIIIKRKHKKKHQR